MCWPEGITFANNRFYVVDSVDEKVYAYSAGAAPGTADSQPSFGTTTVSNRTYTAVGWRSPISTHRQGVRSAPSPEPNVRTLGMLAPDI